MNINIDALGYTLIVGLVALAVRVLLNRMDDIEKTLSRHGMKLVRIETKLGIADNNNGDA
jgi:hypothetical protein